MNKLTLPENNNLDLYYIGGFTRIIFKDIIKESKDKL